MRPQKMELWNEFLPDQLKVEPTTDIPKPATTEAEPDDDKGAYSRISEFLIGVYLHFILFRIKTVNKLD